MNLSWHLFPLAKVSCRAKILIFCDQPKVPRVKARPGPVSLGDWSLALTLTGCTESSHLEPIFLKPELPLLSKITTGASHFLLLPPLILNRHHILLCWDQLIMYCCSAPVQTAAVFSITETAAFWQGSTELYSVAVPSSSAKRLNLRYGLGIPFLFVNPHLRIFFHLFLGRVEEKRKDREKHRLVASCTSPD
uniref:Uncharacterized protein n=1 Tax=Myotis myotis TaxID=51298 RepID=A0A7J7S262_MYOMY|nr:hypothetical protein mMyoMyo1_010096 [Myotis myotis]